MGERGFTLIEVAVAMAVFMVGVMVAARMQGNAVRSLKLTGETSMAMNLAVSTLETLRVETPYEEINGTGPHTYFDRFGAEESEVGRTKYLVQWSATTGDYYVDVNVGVYWNAGSFDAPTDPSDARHRVRTVNTRIINRDVFRR